MFLNLKKEINNRRELIPQSKFFETFGALDLSGSFITISKEMVQFSEIEILDEKEVRLIHKSCLMREQLSKKKKKVIDFVITEMGGDLVILVRKNLPADIREAELSIASTKKYLKHEPAQTDILHLNSFVDFSYFNNQPVMIKLLLKTMRYYNK